MLSPEEIVTTRKLIRWYLTAEGVMSKENIFRRILALRPTDSDYVRPPIFGEVSEILEELTREGELRSFDLFNQDTELESQGFHSRFFYRTNMEIYKNQA